MDSKIEDYLKSKILDTDFDKYQKINDDMVKSLIHLKNTNNDCGGLFNYYDYRISNNQMIRGLDLLYINFIRNKYNKDSKIIEIAAGLGQSAIALKQLGYYNIEINECGNERCKLIPNLTFKMNISNIQLQEKYLQNIDYSKYDVIYCIEGVASCIENNTYNIFKNLLIKGKEIILCSGLFGSKDDSSFCDTLKKEFKYEIIENKGKSVWGEQWYDYDDNSNWEIIRFYN